MLCFPRIAKQFAYLKARQRLCLPKNAPHFAYLKKGAALSALFFRCCCQHSYEFATLVFQRFIFVKGYIFAFIQQPEPVCAFAGLLQGYSVFTHEVGFTLCIHCLCHVSADTGAASQQLLRQHRLMPLAAQTLIQPNDIKCEHFGLGTKNVTHNNMLLFVGRQSAERF